MRFCQIGVGRIGSLHAAHIADHPDCDLAYVIDRNDELAQAIAAKLGAQTAPIDAVLGDPGIDAVVIASSSASHDELIEAAARAGKAIFCEQPAGLSSKRTEAVLAVVSECGVPFFAALHRRFDPQIAAFKRRLDKGEIGKVEQLLITSREPMLPPIDYLRTSGGLFRDMMLHDFDLARWLLGEGPTEVYTAASVLVDPTLVSLGDVDTAIVTLKTRSGKLVQVNNSRRAVYGFDQRLEAFGSGGMLRMGNRVHDAVELSNAHGTSLSTPMRDMTARYREAFRLEFDAFVEALKTGKPPQPGPADARAAIQIADAATESMETGKPVAL